MTITVVLSLEDLEDVVRLLNKGSAIIAHCHPEAVAPAEMAYHAAMLQKICEERRQEIFSGGSQ